ncbi:universal stress protein [Flagellatimonas centrodinii]|uniref:universal stress protein n=1 Tax=Flagellatimonas centrodinii TaxID=2806210 RepID=UPI001FFDD3B9|nr:universal stress protein [Flagellatimonas centrodinii]ULQ46532.1 universal stress protein [Flagellatimonas centrodinii]
MTDLHRILFATDFSEASHNAQAQAVQLARHHDAELHLLNVLVIPPAAYVPEHVPDLDGLTEAMRAQARRQMDHLVDTIGIPVAHSLLSGFDAATVIADHAEKIDASLIVVGSHGRAGLKKLFLGSDAQGVVRLSKRPVLVVNARHGSAPVSGGFDNIVAAVDLSPASADALAVAAALARQHSAKFAVLHVVEDWPIPPYYPTRFEQAQVEHGTAGLAAFLQDHPVRPEPQRQVVAGSAPQVILQYAEADGRDLIVMARGGMGSWAHFLLGSVTERVLSRAPCSVWVCGRSAASTDA